MVQIIGIIGGMGPEATNKLCSLITEMTPAAKDQDHIPVITFSNPYIPDRTKAILNRGPSPLPALFSTIDTLQKAGANFLLVPCNTAHYYLEDLRAAADIPVLDMISETVNYVVQKNPGIRKVGLLATTGTVRTGLYKKAFHKQGIEVIAPHPQTQSTKVMEAIYGPEGIKAGRFDLPRKLLLEAVDELIKEGAELIIAGCTEIPLVFQDENFSWVDPSRILAASAIKHAMGITCERKLVELERLIA